MFINNNNVNCIIVQERLTDDYIIDTAVMPSLKYRPGAGLLISFLDKESDGERSEKVTAFILEKTGIDITDSSKLSDDEVKMLEEYRKTKEYEEVVQKTTQEAIVYENKVIRPQMEEYLASIDLSQVGRHVVVDNTVSLAAKNLWIS